MESLECFHVSLQGFQWESATTGTLHNFTGGNDGGDPLGGVVLDSSNNVYGTTLTGGDLNCKAVQDSGCGVVYKLTH